MDPPKTIPLIKGTLREVPYPHFWDPPYVYLYTYHISVSILLYRSKSACCTRSHASRGHTNTESSSTCVKQEAQRVQVPNDRLGGICWRSVAWVWGVHDDPCTLNPGTWALYRRIARLQTLNPQTLIPSPKPET